MILLEYPGENHGLARPANQQDYTVRMKEFFDHYLKGADAPDWLEYGVPRLKMQEHIDQRLKEREKENPQPPPAADAAAAVSDKLKAERRLAGSDWSNVWLLTSTSGGVMGGSIRRKSFSAGSWRGRRQRLRLSSVNAVLFMAEDGQRTRSDAESRSGGACTAPA